MFSQFFFFSSSLFERRGEDGSPYSALEVSVSLGEQAFQRPMEKRQQILRPAQDRIPRRGQSQGEEDSAQGDHKNRTRSGQRHWWPLIWLRRVFSGGANYLMRLRYQTRATPFLSCVMEKGSIPIVRAILFAVYLIES